MNDRYLPIMASREMVVTVTVMAVLGCAATQTLAWGSAHRWIRQWAIERLPQWQVDYVGDAHLEALATKYTSLQDAHAGGTRADLDRYCVVPAQRLSLHDVNDVAPTLAGMTWYLERTIKHLRGGERDEAMKYLGVLCHWCEDPGSLGAHTSPVSEATLRVLLPPPAAFANRNYLYGAGWIGLEKDVGLDDGTYQPLIIGRDVAETAARLTHLQRLLMQRNAGLIVPAIIGRTENDTARFDKAVGDALAYNARLVADIIYTVTCLAAQRVDPQAITSLNTQSLIDWVSDYRGGGTSHPYYVVPFIKNQAMDAERRLHPLALPDGDGERPVSYGLGMGTPFKLTYTLANNGSYERFVVDVGLHPTAGPEAGIIFAIVLDNQEIARSTTMTTGQAAQRLSIALPKQNIFQLTLVTIAAEDSTPTHNLAVWAEPHLLRKATENTHD